MIERFGDSKDVVCFDREVWETVRQCFDREVWETVRQCFDRKVWETVRQCFDRKVWRQEGSGMCSPFSQFIYL